VDQILASTDAFSPSNVIGKSPCATWYMAIGLQLDLHQKATVNRASSNAVYAIKSVSLESLGATAGDLATVRREIAAISSLRHPYLLPLLAWGAGGGGGEEEEGGGGRVVGGGGGGIRKLEQLYLVYPFARLGSMEDEVLGQPGAGRASRQEEEAGVAHEKLAELLRLEGVWQFRLRCLAEAAAGLAFLHTCKLVHGGVKAANIVIDSFGRARLGDALVNRELDGSMTLTSQRKRGVVDPLIALSDTFGAAQDGFDLGLTALVLLTGMPLNKGGQEESSLLHRCEMPLAAYAEADGDREHAVAGVLDPRANWPLHIAVSVLGVARALVYFRRSQRMTSQAAAQAFSAILSDSSSSCPTTPVPPPPTSLPTAQVALCRFCLQAPDIRFSCCSICFASLLHASASIRCSACHTPVSGITAF
jgi:serine/threonine protein kinase